jgi:hypothetical protein
MVLIVFLKYYVKIAIKTYLRTKQIKIKVIKKYPFNSFGNPAITTILQTLSKAIYFSTLFGILPCRLFYSFGFSAIPLFP